MEFISLAWTAMALAASCGIKLIFGQQPFATPDTICIFNPKALPRTVVLGVIAHECGHKRFTKFEVYDIDDEIRKRALNALEDVRIETLMCRLYRGCRNFLSAMVEYLLCQGWFEVPDSDHPVVLMHAFILMSGRTRYMGQATIQEKLNVVREKLEQVVGPDIVETAERIMSGIPMLSSTDDCLVMADRLLKLVRQDNQNQQQQGGQSPQSGTNGPPQQTDPGGQAGAQGQDPQSNQSGQSGSQGGDPQSGQGAQPSHPGLDPQSPPGNQKGSNGSDANAAASGPQTGDQGQGQPSKQGVASADPSQNPSSSQGSPTGATGQQQQTASGGQSKAPGNNTSQGNTWMGGEPDMSKFVADPGQKLLEALARGQTAMSSRDIIPPTISAKKGVGGDPIVQLAKDNSRVIRLQMQQLLDAHRHLPSVRRVIGRKIDRKRLPTWQIDPRVFIRKTQVDAPNTRLHLLVDRSGSMNGNPISVAMQAAAALAMACEPIEGVSVEVTGFAQEENGGRNLITPLLRANESMTTLAVREGFNTQVWDRTPTAEALLWTAAQIVHAREERKVILLITDGKPSDLPKTKEVLAYIKRHQPDVEVLGIGIAVPDIQEWLPSSVVLKNVKDLRTTVFSLAAQVLIN